MDVLESVGRFAAEAWLALVALFNADTPALAALWRFVAALQDALSYVTTRGVQPAVSALTTGLGAANNAVAALRDAVNRTAAWVWTYMITPVRAALNTRIDREHAFTVAGIAATVKLAYQLYLADQQFTILLVGAERGDRIKDVQAARQYAATLVKSLHQAIENEAASGYRAGKGERTGPLAALVADLHLRGLIDTAVNQLLVKAISILAVTGNPVVQAAVTRVLAEVIKHTGIGKDLGDYLYSLLIPGAGGPDPKDLPSVVNDIAHRIGAIEDWITGFMLDGGPEVKQAGREWKTISSLAVDGALLAFVGQAVAAPEVWAREVADTVGTVANDALGGILDLIHRA